MPTFQYSYTPNPLASAIQSLIAQGGTTAANAITQAALAQAAGIQGVGAAYSQGLGKLAQLPQQYQTMKQLKQQQAKNQTGAAGNPAAALDYGTPSSLGITDPNILYGDPTTYQKYLATNPGLVTSAPNVLTSVPSLATSIPGGAWGSSGLLNTVPALTSAFAPLTTAATTGQIGDVLNWLNSDPALWQILGY